MQQNSVILALVSYHVWQGGFQWCGCLWANPASLSSPNQLIGVPTRLRWYHYFDRLSVPSSILSEWHPGDQGHSDAIDILSLAEWAADLQLSRSCHFPHTHLTGTWPLSVTAAQGREGHCRTSVPKINDRPSLSVFLISKTVSLDLCPTATMAFLMSLKNFSVPLPLI